MIDFERVRHVFETVLAVFRRDPDVSATVTLLTLGGVMLIVSILLIALLIVLTPRKKRVVVRRAIGEPAVASDHDRVIAEEPDTGVEAGRGTDDVADRAERFSTRIRVSAVLLAWPTLLVLAIAVFASGYVVSGTNVFCTYYCHAEVDLGAHDGSPSGPIAQVGTSEAAAERAHHVRCASCHSSGIVADVFDRGRMLAAAFAGRASEDVSAIVDSDRCVRCHSGVVDEVVTTSAGTLQVSHAEPHAAGMVCTACHQRIGHQGAVEPSMSQCLECHDSVIASAECSACHLVEPTGAAAVAEGRGAGSIIYQPVALDSGNCYGCHETESCDACHGLRLPHPVEYIQGGHAYDAAWEGKEQLCYQCHDPQECSLCHRSFSPASSHPPSFREEHKSLSRDASCYCHDQRRPPSQRGRPFCEACH